MGLKTKIAFLVYNSWSQRRGDNSFDGKFNIGVQMLSNVLQNNKIEINYCDVNTAKRYDLILVSFTSVYDILSFSYTVGRNKDWRKSSRKFKVIGGGFGMQNPIPIKEWIDYAWFGRCEDNIVDLVKNYKDYQHDSFMTIDNIRKIKINQSSELYNQEILIKQKGKYKPFKENTYGCPNKCYYCHYTWARKFIQNKKSFELQHLGQNNTSIEIDMFNKDIDIGCIPKINIGLDGLKEETRYLVNRRVSNEQVKEMLLKFSLETKAKALVVKMFNIYGFENENKIDLYEIIKIAEDINSKMGKFINLIIHSTPLHPSPLTPIAYSKVNIEENLNLLKNNHKIYENTNISIEHGRHQESNYRLIEALSVERGSEATQSLFNLIVFNNKFKSGLVSQKMRYLKDNYDLTSLCKSYEVYEKIPTWFLESYTPQENIKKMRLQMLRKLQ